MPLQLAFYKGRTRLFNRAVSWWTRGPYSHCELVTAQLQSGALCWSASLSDGGVRLKVIPLDPDRWDLVDLSCTPEEEARAVAWFKAHEGQGYDLVGLLGQVWRAVSDDGDKWFCNEAVGAALGVHEPWRFDPNSFYSLFLYLQKERGNAA